MKEMTHQGISNFSQINKQLIFIHSPFCGTCHLARKMLETIEVMDHMDSFYEMNAALFPVFMQENKITSVPCLLMVNKGIIEQKLYSFESVTKVYTVINSFNNTH